MGRRIELKAVVNDLCQSFSTRNNDFKGYWAVGQLYKAALDNDVTHIQIDILGNNVIPNCPSLNDIATTYKDRINQQLTSRGIKRAWVAKAKIEYWFETEINQKLHNGFGAGNPFISQLSIESDMGKIYSGKFGGRCRLHNQNNEVRRLGF